MPKVVEIKGLDKLFQTLDKLRRDSERKNNGNVVVGYSAAYAVYVHENLESRHTVGEAKYLEKPARKLIGSGVVGKVIIAARTQGIQVVKALLIVGLRLQRESQKLVPVDTGNLKGSAFTEKE